MTGRPISDNTLRIQELARQGFTARQICDAVGCSESHPYAVARRLGFKIRRAPRLPQAPAVFTAAAMQAKREAKDRRRHAARAAARELRDLERAARIIAEPQPAAKAAEPTPAEQFADGNEPGRKRKPGGLTIREHMLFQQSRGIPLPPRSKSIVQADPNAEPVPTPSVRYVDSSTAITTAIRLLRERDYEVLAGNDIDTFLVDRREISAAEVLQKANQVFRLLGKPPLQVIA